MSVCCFFFFFFSSRRRHTRCSRDWSSDVCSSDLPKRLKWCRPREARSQLHAGDRRHGWLRFRERPPFARQSRNERGGKKDDRSEEHTSELQSRLHLVCRLLLEKKKKKRKKREVKEVDVK